MGIQEDLQAGKFLGIDDLKKMVKMRQAEEPHARSIAKARQSAADFQDPKANVLSLIRGVSLIQNKHPEAAKLLSTIILLTQKFRRTHEEAIAIIATEAKQSLQFVRNKELEAVKRVMDAIESSAILQLA